MLFLPQLRQKECIILAEEMLELCAFSSNSSSLSHNLHKKKPLDEVWLLPLKDILILLYLNFLFQICDRISIASTASDVSQISSNSVSLIPPLWHFPNSTEPSEAYYCHPVLRHGQEESCPRTFLGQKSVRQKADFYLLPCWILGGLTLSAPSCGADLPQPPYTQRISVVLALAFYENCIIFNVNFLLHPLLLSPFEMKL